jgi:hypothetical protein
MGPQSKVRRRSPHYRVVDVFTEHPLEGNPRQPPVSGYRKLAESMETSEASPSSVIYVGAVSLLAVAREVLPCVT